MKNTRISGLPVPPSRTVPITSIAKSSRLQARKNGSRSRLRTIRWVGRRWIATAASTASANSTARPGRLARVQVSAT